MDSLDQKIYCWDHVGKQNVSAVLCSGCYPGGETVLSYNKSIFSGIVPHIIHITHNFLFRSDIRKLWWEQFTGKWVVNPHLLSAIKRTRQEYAQSCWCECVWVSVWVFIDASNRVKQKDHVLCFWEHCSCSATESEGHEREHAGSCS